MIEILRGGIKGDKGDPGPIGPPGVGAKTAYFIAASDAPDLVKDSADFVCSGVDDHVIIEQAIDLLPSYGGRISLSIGTFNGFLRVRRPHVTVVGAGWQTVVKIQDNVTHMIDDCPIRVLANHVQIKDLTVDGNKTGQTWVDPDNPQHFFDVRNYDGVAIYADFCDVDNVRAQNCWGHHLSVWSDAFPDEDIPHGARCHNVFRNCWVMDKGLRNVTDIVSTAAMGPNFDNNICYDNKFINCKVFAGQMMSHTSWDTTIQDCELDGAQIGYHTNSHRIKIINNILRNSPLGGIYAQGGTVPNETAEVRRGRGCVIMGNTIIDSNGPGIQASYNDDILIKDNIIIRPAEEAIRFRNLRGGRIEGNTIHDSQAIAILHTGTGSISKNHGLKIIGNTIYNCGNHSIRVSENSGVQIKGNRVINAKNSIRIHGACDGLEVSGNYIDTPEDYSLFISSLASVAGSPMLIENNDFESGQNYCMRIFSDVGGVRVINNRGKSTQRFVYIETGLTDNITFERNEMIAPVTVFSNRMSASIQTRYNKGYITESQGDATIPSGSTSVTVAHGLNRLPSSSNITVTPNNAIGAASKFWVSNVGSSTFNINVNVDPGVGANFSWKAAF